MLNVHLLWLRMVPQGIQFPDCCRCQDVSLAIRCMLTSTKSPSANPMFLPRAVAPTLHGRFFFGPAYIIAKRFDVRTPNAVRTSNGPSERILVRTSLWHVAALHAKRSPTA